MCVVFKGTGPGNFAEWLIDATCAQENAQDCASAPFASLANFH